MRTLCLSLAGLLISLFLSAQNRSKTEAERRAWADQVYKEAILSHDSMKLAEAYYLMGKIESMTTGNYLRTRVWYLKSLWIQERRGPGYELARLYLRLGLNEQVHGNYKEALKKYHKALTITDIDNSRINAMAYLGNFYADYDESPTDKGKYNPYVNYDSAAWYYDKAVALALKTGNKEGIAELAVAREKLSQMQGKSIDHSRLTRAAEEVSGQNNVTELRSLLRLADSFMDKRDFRNALLYLDKAKLIFEQYLPFERVADRLVESAYISFYERQGDWKSAYQLQRQREEKERRRLIQNQNGEAGELREFYEAEEKEIVLQSQERELELFGKHIRLQQRSVIFMGILSAVTAFLMVMFYRLYRKNRSISRQNALLVQEQSHRFRNHLQVVSDLLSMQSARIDAHSAQKAMEESHLRLDAISTLHSKLYRKDKLNTLQLDRFLKEIVSGVLRAFDFKFVGVSYRVEPVDITPDEALPLGLIITELTTNACKYAFADHPAPRYEIVADISGYELLLKVTDNGFAREKTLPGTSFGMKIIALQVKQLNGEYRFHEKEGRVFEMRYKRPKPAMNILKN